MAVEFKTIIIHVIPVVPVAKVSFIDVFEINSPFMVTHNKCIINVTQNVFLRYISSCHSEIFFYFAYKPTQPFISPPKTPYEAIYM